MRGEEIVIAAELTGKLGHKCFFCSTKHLRKTALKACARSFVKEVFGYPVVSNKVHLPTLNCLDMARRGQTERANQYEAIKKEAYVNVKWEPNWQDFVTCETTAEAYEIAKVRLAEWRDGAFQTYDNGMKAKDKCLTEFRDLMVKDENAARSPKPFTWSKVRAPGTPPHFMIEGNTVHLWEAMGFYNNYWDFGHAVNGRVVDIDLNRDMILWEIPNVGVQRASVGYAFTKLLRGGKVQTTPLLNKTQPLIEDL